MDEKKIPTIDLSPFLLLAGRRVNDKRGGGREEEEGHQVYVNPKYFVLFRVPKRRRERPLFL